MFQAVHTDRSGRVFVAADYAAAGLAGGAPVALDRAIPLPPDARLVPLADRAAVGLDRRGAPRSLGAARWALGAVLPRGHVRTHLPACVVTSGAPPLEPLAYAAVGADAHGELVAAAVATGPSAAAAAEELAGPITARLRAEPANRVLRQLARCAKEYGCAAARDAFLGRADCALPVGAPADDAAAPVVALHRSDERAPLAPVVFQATATDVAAVAVAHLAGGAPRATFGRACEGEPLLRPRLVRDAIERIRSATAAGEIALRTNASSGHALAGCAQAGLDRAVVRLASANAATYERVHRPVGFRWSDVHATLRDAAARRLALTIEVLALPGLTDRRTEADALLSLLGEMPDGAELRIAELAADPYALLARLEPDTTATGMIALLERIAAEAAHLRRAA